MKREGWVQPPRGFVKLNVDVDASFDHDVLRGTTDVASRDDRERFIAGGTGEFIGARMS